MADQGRARYSQVQSGKAWYSQVQPGTVRHSAEKTDHVLLFLKSRRFEDIKYDIERYVWGMSGPTSGACVGHHLAHIWDIIWACLGHHLGHVWASSGACLGHHLGNVGIHLGHVWGSISTMDNNPRCYMHL